MAGLNSLDGGLTIYEMYRQSRRRVGLVNRVMFESSSLDEGRPCSEPDLPRSSTDLPDCFSVWMMIVQPGGNGELELLNSFDLKVTPPNTGDTENVRPFGRWQLLCFMMIELNSLLAM